MVNKRKSLETFGAVLTIATNYGIYNIKSFKPIQMKKLFFTIALLVALNSAAQNRFTKAFQQTDSILFVQTIQEIEADTTMITLSVHDILLIYFSGCMSGADDYKEKGSFDFEGLLKGVRVQRFGIDLTRRRRVNTGLIQELHEKF